MNRLMNFNFGIILVNYNNAKDTIDCIDSLLSSNYKKFKIFIVDNSINEESIKKIKKYLIEKSIEYSEDLKNIESEVLLVRCQNNGFAAANNVILKENNSEIDFYWILNNDTSIPFNFLQKLNEKLVGEKETIYSKIYSNAILYFDTNTIQAIGGTINYFSGTPKHNYNNEVYLSSKEYNRKSDYPVGASIIIHKTVLDKIGLMCENYFLYFEEVDWMQKAKSKNISLKIFTDIHIYHKEGKSTGGNTSDTAFYYFTRNRFYFSNKTHKNILVKVLSLGYIFLISTFSSIKHKKTRIYFKIIKEFYDGSAFKSI
jgi:GT2 family glycosyltransferase